MVDFTGKRGWLSKLKIHLEIFTDLQVFVGNMVGIVGYLLMGLTNLSPIYGAITIGVHFALVPAALWPTLPLLTDRYRKISMENSLRIRLGPSLDLPLLSSVPPSP